MNWLIDRTHLSSLIFVVSRRVYQGNEETPHRTPRIIADIRSLNRIATTNSLLLPTYSTCARALTRMRISPSLKSEAQAARIPNISYTTNGGDSFEKKSWELDFALRCQHHCCLWRLCLKAPQQQCQPAIKSQGYGRNDHDSSKASHQQSITQQNH